MRGRIPTALVLCIVCTSCFAAPIFADRPHQRNGFFIGFGLGGGGAQWEDSADRTGGGVGNFRVGYAVAPNMTVGLESSSWVKRENAEQMGELTLIYNVSAIGATYFPGNKGAFLKGGIGFATATLEDLGYIPELSIGTFDIERSGIGLLAAVGYEWRLTQKFAVGPEIEIVYLNVGDLFNDANYISSTFMMDWYW